VTTGWPQVQAKGEELGIGFDWWQQALGRVVLGKRADGKYAATVGGVVLSIPRQVGKTYFVGALLVLLCVLFPGMKIIWTAHRTRTATNTFQSLQGMCRRKKVAPHVANVRTTNGEQEISFLNGSRILFGAREQGFGRGFDEVDIEVFDEAQILTEKALEDMVAATNQAQHPHGALLFYMGTPPRPVDPGEAFSLRRVKALDGKSKDMVFCEFSADPDADPDDRAQWAKANVSFPDRTPLESMLRLRENLPSDESWFREALGIWDDVSGKRVIPEHIWASCADEQSMAADLLALAIDVSPDRSVASVAMAGQRADEDWHIELDEQRNGTGWIVQHVKRRCEANKIRAVVVDGMSPAASLIPDLEREKIHVTVTSARDMAQACGAVYDGAFGEWLHHIGQPQVNAALGAAGKRDIGDGGWGWSRKNSELDITALVACTLALWGSQAARQKVKRPGRGSAGGRSVGGRRAVVLA